MNAGDIDTRVVNLVGALNGLPGIATFSSCGGHVTPLQGQVPAGEFYVCFYVEETSAGWRSLERIVWAASDANVTAWFNGDELYEGGLCFELYGVTGLDPDEVARKLL